MNLIYPFLVCILLRCVIVLVTWKVVNPSEIYLKLPLYMTPEYLIHFKYAWALFLLFVSLGFLYQTIKNDRVVGAFGQLVWWQSYRPIHSFLYMLACLAVLSDSKRAYVPLVVDVIIGIYAFMRK